MRAVTRRDPHLDAWQALAAADLPWLTHQLEAHPQLGRGPWVHPTLGGWGLLHYVVDRADPGCLELALELGCEPCGTRDDPAMTPLRLALTKGFLTAAARLVEAGVEASPAEAYVLGADPAAVPADEALLALQLACRLKRPGHVRAALLALGEGDEALTALHLRVGAVQDPVTLLVDHGHLTETWMGDGTPVGWVREVLSMVDPWLTHEAEVASARLELPGPYFRRAVPTPASQRFLDALNAGWLPELRAALGADPSLARARSLWGMPALYHPGSHAAPTAVEVVDLLVDRGADLEGSEGLAALLGACWWGSTPVIRRLLERAPELAAGRRGAVPLVTVALASQLNPGDDPAERVRQAELLLEAGAPPDGVDRWGIAALGLASDAVAAALRAAGAEAEHLEGLEAFFEAAAAGDAVAAQGRLRDEPRLGEAYHRDHGGSALLVALDAGHGDLAAILEAEARGRGGPLALDLHEAAALGDVAATRAALQAHGVPPARVGAPPPDRPLHVAAHFGRGEVVELLLGHGYSPAAPNGEDIAGDHLGPPATWGLSPVEVAAARGHQDMVTRFFEDQAALRVGIAP